MVSPDEIRKAKADTLHAPHRTGIRIIWKDALLINNARKVAGYLQMRDTRQLRVMLNKSQVSKDIIQPWDTARQQNFGCVVKGRDKLCSWQRRHLFQFLSTPDWLKTKHTKYSIPIPPTALNSTVSLERGYLTWAVAMYRLIQAAPEYFPDDEPWALPLARDISAENWHRAYWILRYYQRSTSDARQSDSQSAPKPQTHPADTPVYFTDEELAMNPQPTAADEEAMLDTAKQWLQLSSEDESSDEDGPDDDND